MLEEGTYSSVQNVKYRKYRRVLLKSLGLKAPKKFGEKALILAKGLNLLNRELRVQRLNDYVYVPLIGDASSKKLEEIKKRISDVEIGIYTFNRSAKQIGAWWRHLEDRLPPHLLASIPHSIDFVGDVAIIELSSELTPYKKQIGEALLVANKRIKTVLVKAGAVGGTYRLREFEVIAGEKKTTTVYKEDGCIFYIDLAKTYFSPRLSYEHQRITSLVNEGETILDMFAGVGPFAIHIAKKHENVRVYAVDINPEAVKLLEKSIFANRVVDKVTALLGDAREIVAGRIRGIADRVVMNLPENALAFVDVACEALKPRGGVIHYYEFAETPNPMGKAKLRLVEAVEKSNRHVEKVLTSRLVRPIAPFTWQIVVDAQIK